MVRHDAKYENLAMLAAQGKYKLVDPLDYKILELLPEEGEMFGGLYPLGERAESLAKMFEASNKVSFPPATIATRLRVMRQQKLVGRIAGIHGSVWQRTQDGTKQLNKWKEKENTNGHISG